MDKKVKKANLVLRILGPIILVVGIGLDVVGIIGEFEYWFLIPIGMFMLFIGAVLSMFGYMNAINKYVNETNKDLRRDVISDSTNVMKEALSDKVCPHCGKKNDSDAAFCDKCGNSLQNVCLSCGCENDGDAKYCKKCGKELY